VTHASAPAPRLGEPGTHLVIIRGNSGSGKTSMAREVRRRYGRGCALIEQDQMRRIVLGEHDTRHIERVAPGFITNSAAYALAHGYHVVLEGVMFASRYRDELTALIDGHPGRTSVFYLDIPFEETARRHQTKPDAAEVTVEQIREWYEPHDLLGVDGEHLIGAASTLEESAHTVLTLSGLDTAAALSGCPNTCPRCQAELAAARA
jgi:predicted kinase